MEGYFPDTKFVPKILQAAQEVTHKFLPKEQCVEFSFPDGISTLLWKPWDSKQVQPERLPGTYQPITVYGKQVVMPRRTRCFGIAYHFSGQTHPLEPETPQSIIDLCNETQRIFDLPYPPNMCLENDYDNGRECIGRHSDDESQFGTLNDVYCWVTGRASRLCIFREKTSKKIVLSICIPAGLYVMRGRQFQAHYTHEIPQCNEAVFKRVLATWPNIPAELDALGKAAWLKRHAIVAEKDRSLWDEWCLERTSYTLRHFVENKKQKRI